MHPLRFRPASSPWRCCALLTLCLPLHVFAAPRSINLQPGSTELVELSANETELQINWPGATAQQVLVVQQMHADVVLKRHSDLVVHNAPTGGFGPEIALVQGAELIRVTRKVEEPIAWRMRVSSQPVTASEREALALVQAAHWSNGSGTAGGQERALSALSKALVLRDRLPQALALECPIRVGMGALARRLSRFDAAQSAYEDSIEACPNPAWHARAENGLGLLAKDRQEFDLARQHFARAREAGIAAHDTYEAVSAANNLCLVKQHKGTLLDTKACYESVIHEYRQAGLATHIATGLVNLGATVDGLGEPDLALKSFREAMEIRRRVPDALELAKALNNYARALAGIGELQPGLYAISESEAKLRDLGNPDLLAQALLIKADLHEQLGDDAALKRDIDDLQSLAELSLHPRTEAQIWMLRARSMAPAEALILQQKSASVWRNTDQPAPLAEALLGISQSAWKSGEIILARRSAQEAIALADHHHLTAVKADALLHMSRLMQLDDPDSALRQAREANKLNDRLRRLAEQADSQHQIALLLRELGKPIAAMDKLQEATGLALQDLSRPLSQRLRRLRAAQATNILATWADWLLAGAKSDQLPVAKTLEPLLDHWTELNQWRNRTDLLDANAKLQLAEWRAKLLMLQNPELSNAERERLKKRVALLEQQLDLLGADERPSTTEKAGPVRDVAAMATAADPPIATVLILPGREQVYAIVEIAGDRQVVPLPARATLLSWQAEIQNSPNDLRLWSVLDQQLEPLRSVLGPAQDIAVFDPELLAAPWLGLLADTRGEMLIEGRSLRYLQFWSGLIAAPTDLSPLRLGWPGSVDTAASAADGEKTALMRALPELSIVEDLTAAQGTGPWILQIPGHHAIDQSGLAQAVALAPVGGTQLFGPERLDQYPHAPKLVFLNACRGHNGMSGLGLLALIARPGVQTAIVNAWNVPNAAATNFAVRFYKRLAVNPHQPARALAETQAEFARLGKRRLLHEWGGYVLVELAAEPASDSRLRE